MAGFILKVEIVDSRIVREAAPDSG